MYEVFIADCKREMKLRKMTNKSLAEATGYKKSTIDAFFANLKAREPSRMVAEKLSMVLDVDFIQDDNAR